MAGAEDFQVTYRSRSGQTYVTKLGYVSYKTVSEVYNKISYELLYGEPTFGYFQDVGEPGEGTHGMLRSSDIESFSVKPLPKETEDTSDD